MITVRSLTAEDLPLLAQSLSNDSTHVGTTPEFFTQVGSLCNVYEDETGTVMFARASKALRLDLQYVDNADVQRNTKAVLEGFDGLAAKAKANGFSEIVFTTQNPALRAFCVEHFGFADCDGEMRKFI
jgi:hypothetical protein